MPQAMTLSIVPRTDGLWDVVWSPCNSGRTERALFTFPSDADARAFASSLTLAIAVSVRS